MKTTTRNRLVGACLISLSLLASNPVFAQAAHNIRDKVTVLTMQNADQKFELAAKLQWNASYKRWDRILVIYNGNPNPPLSHPVWSYLSNMRIPTRAGKRAGENLLYKVFYKNAYCNGITPLASGKPMMINFERDSLGAYQQNEFFADWNCPSWNSGGMKNVSVVNGAEAHQGKALRITLAAGQVGCDSHGHDQCVNWKPHIGAQLDSLTYSYWLKLPSNFNFVSGGRLPGIGSVSPLAEGTRPDGQNGWSVTAAWRSDGTLGQYVSYIGQAGEFMPWNTGAISKGTWHQVKTTVRVNNPNQANGSINTWLDGKPVFSQQNLRFRSTDKLQIERLLFGVYYTGRAPAAPAQVYIDDFSLQGGR